MRYLYNPVTGELDDIVTPKLGEKYFASAESDAIIKQILGQRNPAAEGGIHCFQQKILIQMIFNL